MVRFWIIDLIESKLWFWSRTQTKDAKFNRICERIAHFEQHVKDMCEAALKMRRERPLMYLMVGAILLAFIAFCGQRIDNLLLSYLTSKLFIEF